MNEDKIRLYIDMDGTLAVFTPVDTMETLYEKGYFLNLEPHHNVIEGVKEYIKYYPEREVYILSSVLEDSKYALDEKNQWLDKYLPEIDQDHRIFPPCGKEKTDYIDGGITPTDILLDDYTANLFNWQEKGGQGIKLMNAINGKRGTWRGSKIDFSLLSGDFFNAFRDIITDKQKKDDIIKDSDRDIEKKREKEDHEKRKTEIDDEKGRSGNEIRNSAGEVHNFQRRDGQKGNNFDSRIIGRAISTEYIREGGIDFLGEKISSPGHLASLMQNYRNPLYETLRGFYIKDDILICAEGITNRLPGFVEMQWSDGGSLASHINEVATILGADKYYLLHNHPSGDPKPSATDLFSTQIIAHCIPVFAGHIVIDHTRFSIIDRDGKYSIMNVPNALPEDIFLHASINHPVLGAKIKDPEIAAELGRKMMDLGNDRLSTLIYLGADKTIRMVEEISNTPLELNLNPEFDTHIFNGLLSSGSINAMIVTSNDSIYSSAVSLIDTGLLEDAVYIDPDYPMYWSLKETGTVKGKNPEYEYAMLKAKDIDKRRLTWHEEINSEGKKKQNEISQKPVRRGHKR